jgi:hypothetical protein
MIALENLRRVDFEKLEMPPLSEWGWQPDVTDKERLEKALVNASSNMTSKKTFTNQTDHGEYK